MPAFQISNELPPIDLYCAWRADEGWGKVSHATAQAALEAGVASVCAYCDDTLVGFARAVGDGAIYGYVQDVIVHPRWRGQGIGRAMMHALLAQLEGIYPEGATLGLMAAKGHQDFYKSFGFISRPNSSFGPGMIRILGAG
ncbi:GNAT family N-acetyltransferase [Henriciella aquimarina]|uniref:GNAT family N-acetyltransferase n=1 Tax=Henriciella aquimarina TaxID=545261 RepID=UPI00130200CB|nr:GNAT family N-acetyltransferase [Henriciella aquimarina]